MSYICNKSVLLVLVGPSKYLGVDKIQSLPAITLLWYCIMTSEGVSFYYFVKVFEITKLKGNITCSGMGLVSVKSYTCLARILQLFLRF